MASLILVPFLILAAGRDASKKQTIKTADPHKRRAVRSINSSHTLAHPLVLPQQSYNADSPFVRAYSDSLPIPEEDFIAFIDSLNVAMCRSPEAQAATVAGYASMIVPGVGTVLGAAVGAGAKVHAATDRRKAVELVLEQGNLDLFRPHGLEASVIGTEQLRDLLGMPPLYSDVVDAPLAEDVDEEEEDGDLYYTNSKRPASIASASPPAYEATPTFPQGANRLAPYAPHVLAPSTVLPPVKVRYHNRDDVLANTSAKTQAWRTQRKEKGAAKKAAKGKGEKLAKLHREALWLVVA